MRSWRPGAGIDKSKTRAQADEGGAQMRGWRPGAGVDKSKARAQAGEGGTG